LTHYPINNLSEDSMSQNYSTNFSAESILIENEIFNSSDNGNIKSNIIPTTDTNQTNNINQVNSVSRVNKNDGQINNSHVNSVMSDLNRLSKSLAHSYQNLEGKVAQLNGELQCANEQKSDVLVEKQKLISEKQAITERLQHLLAILPSGVVVLDGKGIVRDCNAVAIDILGRPLLGESWLNVINRAFLPQADDGHQISLKDGRKIHIETRALDCEPGQMIVLTDMTKTRELQAELSQQQKLSSMGKMIASLAHQIRTPLAAAILYGSHLNAHNLDKNKKKVFSGHLMERLRFMDRQINDMLNFVKGERKDKFIFSVEFFIDSIKSSYDDLNHPIRYEIDSEQFQQYKVNKKMLVGDPDALMGAITNLVNNAIDASEKNKMVTIHFSCVQGERLIVEVKDQGCGITASDKKKLFEPFYSTKNHGNGLGLAIVNGVIIEHKGTIQVESLEGEGSRFIISLPVHSKEDVQLQSGEDESKISASTLPSIATSNFIQEMVYDN